METGQVVINRLPAKTWYWLDVNDSRLSWDEKQTIEIGQENIKAEQKEKKKVVKLHIGEQGLYNRKKVLLEAEEDSEMTVIMDYRAKNHLAVQTELKAHNHSKIRLIQLQFSKQNSVVYNEITGFCEKNAIVEILQIFMGQGDTYADCHIDLSGEKSSFQADIGYMGQNRQKLDMNVVVDHIAKQTESRIQANGALKDAAQKVFRGTIDFKKGSSDSVGNEQETVLMLGNDVANKTIPLILCAEENVVGNHGASIGELDEDTLFYFESRGIDKESAENMLARAAIEHLAAMIEEQDVREEIQKELTEVL